MIIEVPNDHFLHQFDRYPEEDRLTQMAAHCAYLYNALQREQQAHTETVERFIARLGEVSPVALLAFEVSEQLQERTSDK